MSVTLAAARIHRVTTPEGLSLPFVVAPVGDRLSAFLFDLLLIAAGTVVIWVALALSAVAGLLALSYYTGPARFSASRMICVVV